MNLTEQNKKDMDVSENTYSDKEIGDFMDNLPNIVDKNFIILKTIEELNELSTILTQYLTKPNKVTPAYILPEFADVTIWLAEIAVILKFDEKQNNILIRHKVTKLIELSKTIKDWGKIKC